VLERISEETSPLWMVTTEPLLNQFILDLQSLQRDLQRDPVTPRTLHISRTGIEMVRSQFSAMIRHGEADLHRLAQLLCVTFLSTVQIESVVVGEVTSTRERFTLSQQLTAADVYGATDLDLGTRQLKKLQFFDGTGWSQAALVSNVVEYQPAEPNPWNIYRLHTRIKAEEAIWNKVVDEIFDLDRFVQQDKALRHLSRYVKDIFGIKLVVGEIDDVYRLQNAIQQLSWPAAALRDAGVAPTPETQRLELVEVKEYLASGHQKQSGWKAMKSVVRWNAKTFELQIQPLRNFLHERERLTRESHVSFKAQREQVRQQVAEQLPLFRFYRDLLQWLFGDASAPPPAYAGITVLLEP
jgi:ppGpp synthetase/RelA/SpoT-type nucleotidyltranferase